MGKLEQCLHFGERQEMRHRQLPRLRLVRQLLRLALRLLLHLLEFVVHRGDAAPEALRELSEGDPIERVGRGLGGLSGQRLRRVLLRRLLARQPDIGPEVKGKALRNDAGVAVSSESSGFSRPQNPNHE